jgi:hypothetical protein
MEITKLDNNLFFGEMFYLEDSMYLQRGTRNLRGDVSAPESDGPWRT